MLHLHFNFLLVVTLMFAVSAQADTLSEQLQKGPLVRIEVDKKGRFKRSAVLIDINAPVDQVWNTLADFKSYPSYMPRCEEVEVRRKWGDVLVEMELDTPLVSTSYTSRYRMRWRQKEMDVLVIDGDIEGSEFHWKLSPQPSRRGLYPGCCTRVSYSGVVRNFSSVAERLDDDQQSITIGINVVSVLQAAKALKQEAERRHRTARPKQNKQVEIR